MFHMASHASPHMNPQDCTVGERVIRTTSYLNSEVNVLVVRQNRTGNWWCRMIRDVCAPLKPTGFRGGKGYIWYPARVLSIWISEPTAFLAVLPWLDYSVLLYIFVLFLKFIVHDALMNFTARVSCICLLIGDYHCTSLSMEAPAPLQLHFFVLKSAFP